MAPTLSPEYTPLDQALGQLRHHNGELEKFIDELLDEIASLGEEVENRAHQLMEARRQLDDTSQSSAQLSEENSRLQQIIQVHDEAIALANTQIEQLQSQLDQAQAATQGDPADKQRIAELEQQLEQSQQPSEIDPQLSEEVERLRRELAAAKLELLKRDQSGEQAPASDNLDDLKQRNEALEGELHEARGRAVQLTETIDQQRKELNQQKTVWTEELQAMRTLLERRGNQTPAPSQSQSFADTSVLSGTATVTRDELEIRANNNNTVVDSVMAQFAKLQRDVNKRRNQQRS
ncbi:hypothetical protein [Blastopirellula marina]|uniref:Uncharacterized protein n=1 Tax=Blastopirellula marina TaxID=124 RepID=A0A2S8GRI4_9BACT|nr:hypothetical protein [Blastopirellula marina]PQO47036.1 hypothetical protein C5Y93_05965 [Blastopirellula marina]